MAYSYPKPPPETCFECGGLIDHIDGNPPPIHRGCDCPCCKVIGPGHQPMWVLDKEHHVCQTPIDRSAIARAKRRLKDEPLARSLRRLMVEARKKGWKEKLAPAK